MNFTQAVGNGFSHYTDFQARAPRSEFWYWTLFTNLVDLGLAALGYLTPGAGAAFSLLSVLAFLVLLLPNSAVLVRRLHDLDRSGWWSFLVLLPLLGVLILLVWFCTRGTIGANRYGADPLPH